VSNDGNALYRMMTLPVTLTGHNHLQMGIIMVTWPIFKFFWGLPSFLGNGWS